MVCGTGRIEGGSDVLAKQIERKAAVERSSQPCFRQPLLENVVGSGSTCKNITYVGEVGACSLRKNQGLDVRNHDVGDDDLINKLDGLAHAHRPQMVRFPHRLQYWLGCFEIGRIG